MAHLARVQQALAALEAASTFAASRKLTAEEVAAASVVSSEAQTAVDTGELALATAAQSQALARWVQEQLPFRLPLSTRVHASSTHCLPNVCLKCVPH